MSCVLLAEDEFLIRVVLADALEALGLSCIEAPTGQAALDILRGEAPLSAIIVDIGLPDMSGEKVIEAAMRHRPQIPVIRCSGAPATAPAANGNIHVFAKPYSVDELSRFVASLVSGRTS
ncbi:Response regulator receiver domain-containing protein [Enhydrobacter aerosaccus]|uniref:Response regulator receiver domain-containing protein n=1 Tax=Enhydrobacter aerosaccus TaxID=225324 RepID=A0A1T4K142_9HYPH|nr:response regulator [Enhydrobacter aerosaccus]SJZ36098.1 Response regulator receiver domain-containing protein [Enhydrobacter aerosaccus]